MDVLLELGVTELVGGLEGDDGRVAEEDGYLLRGVQDCLDD